MPVYISTQYINKWKVTFNRIWTVSSHRFVRNQTFCLLFVCLFSKSMKKYIFQMKGVIISCDSTDGTITSQPVNLTLFCSWLHMLTLFTNTTKLCLILSFSILLKISVHFYYPTEILSIKKHGNVITKQLFEDQCYSYHYWQNFQVERCEETVPQNAITATTRQVHFSRESKFWKH